MKLKQGFAIRYVLLSISIVQLIRIASLWNNGAVTQQSPLSQGQKNVTWRTSVSVCCRAGMTPCWAIGF